MGDGFFPFQALPGSEYDTFVEGQPGCNCVGTTYTTLKDAVDMLIESVGVNRLRTLKVRSGEHLAAILTTCFLGSAPTQLDTDGGADLVFDNFVNSSGWQSEIFSPKPAAFEVKSLDGRFRKADSQVDRIIERGGDATGIGTAAVFWPADGILCMAGDKIDAARKQVVQKTPDTYSRNIFIIIHMFDHIWTEFFVYHLAIP